MLAALLLLDGWTYLWHRANHTVPLLWRFHRTHHSDDHITPTFPRLCPVRWRGRGRSGGAAGPY
jgi:hypothetical protein